jgi:hypothetical protein
MTSFVKKIIPSSAIARARRLLEYWCWFASEKPNPPPHVLKVRVMRDYARRYGTREFVETGTYLGDTIEAVRQIFAHIYSIEIDGTLFRNATELFKGDPRVSILLGDSAQVLPTVIASLSSPTLFWLDGHYSSGITGKGDKETPIVEELLAIAASPILGHVILIDDARLFNGTHDYPTSIEIKERAEKLWPAHVFEIKDDIIRIYPRTPRL